MPTPARSTLIRSRRSRCSISCPAAAPFRSPPPAASSAASTARTGRFRRRNPRRPRTRAARSCACARRCRRASRLDQMARLSLFPEDVVAVAEALGCPSISYTYSEPTAFYEYTYDTCKAARERKLKNIVVTCGSIEDRAGARPLSVRGCRARGPQGLRRGDLHQAQLRQAPAHPQHAQDAQGTGRLVRDHQPRRADLHRQPRHHPPDVRLDRQGAGAGPAAALLALPSAAQARPT